MRDNIFPVLVLAALVALLVLTGRWGADRIAYVDSERARLMGMCISNGHTEFECYIKVDKISIR